MTEYVKPDVSVQLWTEKPDAAEALMNSASEEASSYADYATIGGGIALGLALLSTIIQRAAGPYGGIVEVLTSVFKKQPAPEPAKEATDAGQN